MNFLAHHFLARQGTWDDSLFFVGNLLPDLFRQSGAGRLQVTNVLGVSGALAEGIRFHFATDQQFHASEAFKEATREATILLRSATFSQPLPRTFFLGHVLVEIVLDGYLLQQDLALSNDLYQHLDSCSSQAVRDALSQILNRPLPDFAAFLDEFQQRRYLEKYATVAGQTEALYRVARHAKLSFHLSNGDREQLQACLVSFATTMAARFPLLLIRSL